jgi:lysylphosphatidylglycerol synthetase-like protein (DUF2156 family)
MMERPKVFKVRIGYNPNSSSYGIFFFVMLSIYSFFTLFASLIFADILFRRVRGERRSTTKIIFVLIPVVSLLGLYCFLLSRIFAFTFALLFLISIALFIFTRYRTSGLISGLFVIIGNTIVLLGMARIDPWLLGFICIFGLIAGYPIDRKRMGKKDEGTF